MAYKLLMFVLFSIGIIYAIISCLDVIFGVDIKKKYGKQILKVLAVFLLIIIGFYVALVMFGLVNLV